jgi:hypothetical protein
VIDREAYCRELEAYLCRKNDGHLIRIVGPAFERVMSWAAQGIPRKVAEAGIDRYFERYYRKGPRRRPVRIEFCEADILDAFDDWRRAIGLALVRGDPEGGPLVEEPGAPPASRHRSLPAHIDVAIARLTALRGSDRLGGTSDTALDEAIRALDSLRLRADRARGAAREAVIDELAAIDRALVGALTEALASDERSALAAEAAAELAPFEPRMTAEAYERARASAVARLVRQRHGVPEIAY